MAIEPLWSKICIKKQRENAALGLFECSLCLYEMLSTGIYHLYNKYSFINEFTLALHRQQHRTTYTKVKLNLKTQFFCWERERDKKIAENVWNTMYKALVFYVYIFVVISLWTFLCITLWWKTDDFLWISSLSFVNCCIFWQMKWSFQLKVQDKDRKAKEKQHTSFFFHKFIQWLKCCYKLVMISKQKDNYSYALIILKWEYQNTIQVEIAFV